MPKKPYGPYDDLTPEQRKAKTIALWAEVAFWTAIIEVLWWGEEKFARGLGTPFLVQLLWAIVILVATLRLIVVMIRWISMQSPNPKLHKPNDE